MIHIEDFVGDLGEEVFVNGPNVEARVLPFKGHMPFPTSPC